MRLDVTGLIVAPFTPMNKDRSLNLEVIPQYIEHFIENKIDNLFILGTTGEGTSLSAKERKQVAEKWVQCGKNKFQKIIVHVGCCDLKTTQELAIHAESISADAIALVPPFYYKAISTQQVFEYVKAVADCVPNTPVLYYHIPSLTLINIDLVELLRLARDNIPNFSGLKYTDADLINFATCVHKYGDIFDMCYGTDENIYFAALLGSKAFVGSTFNFLGKYFAKMLDAVRRKDKETSELIYYKILKCLNTVGTNGYRLGMQKSLTSRVSGVDLGPVRLPNCAANTNDHTIIEKIMDLIKEM